MVFDINMLSGIEDPYTEEAVKLRNKYIDDIINLYRYSDEATEFKKEHNYDAGGWIEPFLSLFFGYIGQDFPKITVGDVKELITEIFPRKVSLQHPSEANEIIPNLKFFFRFLRNQFDLQNAEEILQYFQSVEKDFPGIMNDESKFGLAKSFFMRGKDMGFDMTNKKDMQRFMLYYNANIIADRLSKSDEAVSQTVNEGISSKSHYTKKRKKRG